MIIDAITLVPIAGLLIFSAMGGCLGVVAITHHHAMTCDAFGHAAYAGILLTSVIAALSTTLQPLPQYLLLGALVFCLAFNVLLNHLNNRHPHMRHVVLATLIAAAFGLGTLAGGVVQKLAPLHAPPNAVRLLLGNTAAIHENDVILAAFALCILLLILYRYAPALIFHALDPTAAAVAGVSPARARLLLTTLIAVYSLTGIRSLGALMLMGHLILPAQCVRILHLARSPLTAVIFAIAIAASASVAGVILSLTLNNIPLGACVVAIEGTLTLLAMLSRILPQYRSHHITPIS